MYLGREMGGHWTWYECAMKLVTSRGMQVSSEGSLAGEELVLSM